jgi:hypothetical protein
MEPRGMILSTCKLPISSLQVMSMGRPRFCHGGIAGSHTFLITVVPSKRNQACSSEAPKAVPHAAVQLDGQDGPVPHAGPAIARRVQQDGDLLFGQGVRLAVLLRALDGADGVGVQEAPARTSQRTPWPWRCADPRGRRQYLVSVKLMCPVIASLASARSQ